MSEIRVNTIVAAEGTSAPNLPYGIQVPTGMGITGAGGLNITGVATATSFVGNITGTVTGNATGLTGTPNISCGTIAGSTGTFSGAVNVDATTDSTSTSTGALIVDGGAAIAKLRNELKKAKTAQKRAEIKAQIESEMRRLQKEESKKSDPDKDGDGIPDVIQKHPVLIHHH